MKIFGSLKEFSPSISKGLYYYDYGKYFAFRDAGKDWIIYVQDKTTEEIIKILCISKELLNTYLYRNGYENFVKNLKDRLHKINER